MFKFIVSAGPGFGASRVQAWVGASHGEGSQRSFFTVSSIHDKCPPGGPGRWFLCGYPDTMIARFLGSYYSTVLYQ